MRARAKTTDQPKAGIREVVRENRQGASGYQSRRQEADREKRQKLARLRHEANLDIDKAGDLGHRHKAADRERLKGKGLFYCKSPLEREREIQRRHNEANRENR